MLAQRMAGMKASEIREILKLTEQPDMISFAGGLPEPALFPIQEISQVTQELLMKNGKQALQYSTTEGYAPLREKISLRMNDKFGTRIDADHILLTNGSQQGLDLAGKVLLDPGDIVLCEQPTYLGAIQAFKAYQPRFVEIETDDEGMDLDKLHNVLKSSKVKIIYVMPDFQNPTGRSWSLERRIRFMELIQSFQVVVIEDNPYGELRYQGTALPSLKSMDTEGKVIFLGTFSKILCPGFRLGWLVADKHYREQFVLAKQASDLQTSTIVQRQIDLYLESYSLDEHVESIISLYKSRRDAMLEAMDSLLSGVVRHTNPMGGLFIWAELPAHISAKELLIKSIKQKVAFVPGDSFYPNSGPKHTMRLNFSIMNESQIYEGLQRLAGVIKAIQM